MDEGTAAAFEHPDTPAPALACGRLLKRRATTAKLSTSNVVAMMATEARALARTVVNKRSIHYSPDYIPEVLGLLERRRWSVSVRAIERSSRHASYPCNVA